jgi:enamine deaminase RidA (YjgF/YER057c/UK114 family)
MITRASNTTLAVPLPAAAPPGLRASSAVRSGERVFLSAGHPIADDGTVIGPGDPTRQTHAALDRIERALAEVGGNLSHLTKLTTCIVDRDYRAACYRVIQERLGSLHPVSTGLVVAGLPRAEMIVQIDAEAAIPSGPAQVVRPYRFDSWHGQGFPWRGAMVIATDDEFFVRGQTGSPLDHSGTAATGRSPADAAAQVDLAMTNLATLLREAGSGVEDICKITVYIGDRAYRTAAYPVIGRHLAGVRPVSTGIITQAFARPEILFEIDVVALRKVGGKPHQRLLPYSSNIARYGTQAQALDCEFCMAAVAGDRVILRGQTGIDLQHRMHGAGDAGAQAVQAMINVDQLLAEAGCTMNDVTKATVYVTDRDYLPEVSRRVLERLSGTGAAFTAVIVRGLASPELLMEVDIQAVRGGGTR